LFSARRNTNFTTKGLTSLTAYKGFGCCFLWPVLTILSQTTSPTRQLPNGPPRVKPPRPLGRGFASRAYAPGKEDKHSCIASLDPALKDGRSALRQHFVRGEQAGQAIFAGRPAELVAPELLSRQEFANIKRYYMRPSTWPYPKTHYRVSVKKQPLTSNVLGTENEAIL
jgi:hypothetical protein